MGNRKAFALALGMLLALVLTPPAKAAVIGEAGLEGSMDNAEWHTVSFTENYSSTPYVFVTTQTTEGGQDPSSPHIRSTSSSSFETQHCEWDSSDKCDHHNPETNGWVALNSSYINNSVEGMEVGTVSTPSGSSEPHVPISFTKSFDSTPLVFASIQSEHGSNEPLNVQVISRSTSGATIEFCEQESTDGCDSHTSEDIVWWAVDQSKASKQGIFDWGTASVGNSNWNSISFNTSFSNTPVVIVTPQTENGGQEALYGEADNVNTGGADVRYCEAEGGNGCDTHAVETVAWLAVEPGTITFNSPPDEPSNPEPQGGATGVSTSPSLNVTVTDPEGDEMDVSFYNSSPIQDLNIVQWDHSQSDGADSKSELDKRMDEGSEVEGKDGEGTISQIDCGDGEECNLFKSSDTYSTCITGFVYAPESGTYTFATDSDDASDVYIGQPSTSFDSCDSVSSTYRVASYYGSHADCDCWSHNGQVTLDKGYHTIMYRHSDRGGADDYKLAWKKPSDSSYSIVPGSRFFHGAEDLIGTVSNVPSGNEASVTWSGLSQDKTYYWYAVANDSLSTTQSPRWNFTTVANNPPDPPSNPEPSNGETGVSTSPVLNVTVTDPDGDQMDVTFYNASDSSVIGTDNNIPSGDNASVTWSGLTTGTVHEWYTEACDTGGACMTSSPWSFTTTGGNTPPDSPTDLEPTNVVTTTSPTLSAEVTDSEDDPIDVYFYNDDTDSLVCSVTDVDSGDRGGCQWSGLSNDTTYRFYAKACDISGCSSKSYTEDFRVLIFDQCEYVVKITGEYKTWDMRDVKLWCI